jgi:hypothetical protein
MNRIVSFSYATLMLSLLIAAGCSTNFCITGGGEVGNPSSLAESSSPSYADTVARNVSGVEIKLDPEITIKFISAPASVSNPRKPQGDSIVFVNVPALFTTGGSVSNKNNPIEYRFSLRDSSTSVFSAWSRDSVMTHAWTGVGVYRVAAQARSATDTSVLSGWSESLFVRVQ